MVALVRVVRPGPLSTWLRTWATESLTTELRGGCPVLATFREQDGARSELLTIEPNAIPAAASALVRCAFEPTRWHEVRSGSFDADEAFLLRMAIANREAPSPYREAPHEIEPSAVESIIQAALLRAGDGRSGRDRTLRLADRVVVSTHVDYRRKLRAVRYYHVLKGPHGVVEDVSVLSCWGIQLTSEWSVWKESDLRLLESGLESSIDMFLRAIRLVGWKRM